MNSQAIRFAGLLTAGLLLTACGQAAEAGDRPGEAIDADDGGGEQPAVSGDDPIGDQGGSAAGTCPHGTVNCVDADLNLDEVVDPAVDFDSEIAREQAAELLGLAEIELAGFDDVRVGVVDGEALMLTEDYVLGRRTVELETGADGTKRVTAVTVELPDGPETITSP